MKKLVILFFLLSATAASSLAARKAESVFKAVSDGKTFATEVIQAEIDRCSESGGGEVVIPAGNYLCKTLYLRSHVTLVLSRGATLLGSTDYANDYKEKTFIRAAGITDFGIRGDGTINGQADQLDFAKSGFKNNDKVRPFGLLFTDCSDFFVKDVHIINAGFWTFRMRRCERVNIDGVTIRSVEYINNDGIDIDARDVRIANCIIDSDDDAICLKSDDKDFLPENIVITNCICSSNSNPIKFGTASKAGFRHVTISNCVIRHAPKSQRRHIWGEYRNIAEGTISGLSGIAIECVDGGTVEHITIDNIAMSGIVTPFIIVMNRRRGIVGKCSDINISNITAEAEGVIPCLICGLPEAKITNVSLSNINIIRKSGDVVMTEPLKESPKSYPENRMYGHRNPACGLYARHVDGLYVDNYRVNVLSEIEERPCVILDDVVDDHITRLKCQGTKGELITRK